MANCVEASVAKVREGRNIKYTKNELDTETALVMQEGNVYHILIHFNVQYNTQDRMVHTVYYTRQNGSYSVIHKAEWFIQCIAESSRINAVHLLNMLSVMLVCKSSVYFNSPTSICVGIIYIFIWEKRRKEKIIER